MPPKGFITVSLPKEVMDIAKDFYVKRELELKRMGIRSVPQLLQQSLLFYRENLEDGLKRKVLRSACAK